MGSSFWLFRFSSGGVSRSTFLYFIIMSHIVIKCKKVEHETPTQIIKTGTTTVHHCVTKFRKPHV